jgi:hypothetical protein
MSKNGLIENGLGDGLDKRTHLILASVNQKTSLQAEQVRSKYAESLEAKQWIHERYQSSREDLVG